MYAFSFAILAAIGVIGVISRQLNLVSGSIFIVSGLALYAYAIKQGFNIMLNGGEDKLIDLIDGKIKDDEFIALERTYSFIKNISERLPQELSDYKLNKLHGKEKELLTAQN